LPYQRPTSSADCARELFKGSNRSASLVDCTRKKCFGWGLWIFCDWRQKWSGFGVILANVAWSRAQPLSQSVSLKFSLETRLESKSFEPLINFLVFLVQKLWSKTNKLFNYLISQIFLLTYIITFEPETPAGHPKYQKLVSSKNFSEILPPNGWRPGPGKVGQGRLKVLHLWRHSQKTHTPQAKKFFSSAD